MCCDDSRCLPPDEENFEFKIDALDIAQSDIIKQEEVNITDGSQTAEKIHVEQNDDIKKDEILPEENETSSEGDKETGHLGS